MATTTPGDKLATVGEVKIAYEKMNSKISNATDAAGTNATAITALQATTATHTTDIEGLKAADAELVDIRTGLDGTKYATAGTAVREQFKAVEMKIDDFIATMEGFLEVLNGE